MRRGLRDLHEGVITGLDPVIHPLHQNLAKKMDARVKPAHDGLLFYTAPLASTYSA